MLNALSRHERSLFVETYDGEQCNGFRPRKWQSQSLCFELRIPRTRSGAFRPMILGILKEQEERTALFHELYVRGLTCKDIGEICECFYGRQYSKQQVSFLSNACREDINTWLLRPLSQRYLVLYIDATYVPTRRDRSVSQGAYYSILGLLPDGRQEVLSVVHHSEEGAFSDKTSHSPTLHQHEHPIIAYFSPALFAHLFTILRYLLYKTNTPSRKICTFPRFFLSFTSYLPIYI